MSAPTTGRARTPRPASADDWRHRAACRFEDPELFFPAADKGPTAREQIGRAKAVCRPCEVRGECLQWALATRQDHGVWGGRSVRERRKMDHGDPIKMEHKAPRDRHVPVRADSCGHAAAGTTRGYDRHHRRHEPACRACLDARNEARQAGSRSDGPTTVLASRRAAVTPEALGSALTMLAGGASRRATARHLGVHPEILTQALDAHTAATASTAATG